VVRPESKEQRARSRELRIPSHMPYARRLNRRKYRRRLSSLHTLVMIIPLAIITLASISAFEWLWGNFLNFPIFTLKGVSTQGNGRISSAEVLGASNLHVGTDSIYSIMSHIIEKRIKARFRYLEQVEVQRRLVLERSKGIYGWVTIVVKEREPVALVSSGRDVDSFMVIDAHGFILEERSQYPYGDMPVIIGVDGETLKNIAQDESGATDANVCSTLDLALDVLADARSVIPELFDGISYIDARDPDDIILALDAGCWMLDTGYSIAASGIQHPVSGKAIIRIASGRIEEGLSNALPVIMKRREQNGVRSGIGTTEHRDNDFPVLMSRRTKIPLPQNPRVSFDARFPGAVYVRAMGDE
jgi:cell division septal protein FtsQ